MTLAGAVHKKKFLIPQKAMQEKMEKVQEICEEMEKISDDPLPKFLTLLLARITKDETELVLEIMKEQTELLRVQLTAYSKIVMFHIFELRSRDVLLDPSKLPDALEAGWSTYKAFWRVSDDERWTVERKRVTINSFDNCLQEK